MFIGKTLFRFKKNRNISDCYTEEFFKGAFVLTYNNCYVRVFTAQASITFI